VLTIASLLFAVTANLAIISTVASMTFLVIFAAVNLAAFRLSDQVGLHPVPPATGALLAIISCGVLLFHSWSIDRRSIVWLSLFYGLAIVSEMVLIWYRGARRTNLPGGGISH
jgi:uncharacterized protein